MKTTQAQALHDYLQHSGMTQAAVARGLGVSAATVSLYLQGKYKGDMAEIDRQVEAFLEKQAERAAAQRTAIAYVHTATARRVRDIVRLSHIEGECVVLVGGAGVGKTSALRAYHAANPDSLLLDTDPTFTTKVMLQNLAAQIGVETTGNINELMTSITARLQDSERLILVDEAENLQLRALEVLRRIHDKTGVGLVLAGMPRLLVNLRGKRGELKQLYSRVGFKLDLGETLPDADLTAIACHTLPELDTDTASELVQAAAGNTRRLVKLLRGVSRLAKINHAAVDIEMVSQFKEMLIH